MIKVSIEIERPLDIVWELFTTCTNWVQWDGGKLIEVIPSWKPGAKLIWDLGEPSFIGELIPLKTLMISGRWFDTVYRFQALENSTTLMEIEESDPKGGAYFTDNGASRKVELEMKLLKFKTLIQKAKITVNKEVAVTGFPFSDATATDTLSESPSVIKRKYLKLIFLVIAGGILFAIGLGMIFIDYSERGKIGLLSISLTFTGLGLIIGLFYPTIVAKNKYFAIQSQEIEYPVYSGPRMTEMPVHNDSKCWYCKKRDSELFEGVSAKIRKTVSYEKISIKRTKVTYQIKSVDVPRCSTCRAKHNLITIIANILALIGTAIINGFLLYQEGNIWLEDSFPYIAISFDGSEGVIFSFFILFLILSMTLTAFMVMISRTRPKWFYAKKYPKLLTELADDWSLDWVDNLLQRGKRNDK